MSWYLEVLKKYAVFSGRARRKEYWFFMLFNFLITIAIAIVDSMIGTMNPQLGIGILGAIYAVALLLPSLAVTIRRLHDSDSSGWWILLIFLPLIGPLVLLVFMVLDSSDGDNRFGSNPKLESA